MASQSRRSFVAATAIAGLTASRSQLAAQSTNLTSAGPVRVAQIGTKHAHASGKLATVRKFPEVFEVVGVVEEDSLQRERVSNSAEYQGVRWIAQEQVLSNPQLDLVLVETEIDELLAAANACLSAGKHVHLDKPAGVSLPELREVIELARRKQLHLQMGYMFRSNPAFQFLFDAARDGWLGEIFEVHAVMSKKVGDVERAALSKYKGGSMFELGCHLIDALVALLGRPEAVHAFNQRTGTDSLFDNCLAVFRYPRATATIRSSVVEVDGGRRRQFIVCGTHGTLSIEPLEPAQATITLDRPRGSYPQGTSEVKLAKTRGRYDGELLKLATAIRKTPGSSEKAIGFSYDHDLAVQECVLWASDMFAEPALP